MAKNILKNKVILIILDGWGIAKSSKYNAVSLAKTPNFNKLWNDYSHKEIEASGEAVGLPVGQMGNSEVGHLAMGAGRIVLQNLPRISKSIRDKTFYTNKELIKAFDYAKKENKKIHLLGLLSDGGVHSHESHLYGILEYARKIEFSNLYIHAFTDGRDVSPRSGIKHIEKLHKFLEGNNIGKIATIIGRYYAMDRDNRWSRTKKAYNAMVMGRGYHTESPEDGIKNSYKKGITDEFIEPIILEKEGIIEDDDVIFFFNFRSDRPRQIVHALLKRNLKDFRRSKIIKNPYFISMMSYEEGKLGERVLFSDEEIKNTLSGVLSKNDKRQLHIAETEKYPHVTFFFNGENEKSYKGEKRIMINSPKVATYDMKPEMSAKKISKRVVREINGNHDFIIINFANADMVGHTGSIEATKKAVETVDYCLGKIVSKAKDSYEIIVTADHGNAEAMKGENATTHTSNKVPLIIISDGYKIKDNLKKYTIAGIAPTILEIINIKKPKEMTEKSLLSSKKN